MAKKKQRIVSALNMAYDYGGVDGAHHKEWIIDQMVKALLDSDEKYVQWKKKFNDGNAGPNTYEWPTGIAPWKL